MRAFTALRSLWSNLVRRDGVQAALDEELDAYVDLLAAEHERSGMDATEARRAALIAAGGIEQIKEATRDAWLGNSIAVLHRECRYALRSLRRSPGYVAIAVTTLGVAVGGATAIFTMINAALLRPLPAVAEADRLVSLERSVPKTNYYIEFSYPDFADLNAQSTALRGIAAYDGTSMDIDDRAGAARIWVSYVSDNFFNVLGVHPAVGRLAVSATPGSESGNPSIVIGYALWQSRYHADPNVIGASIKLNGHFFTITGVAAPGFIGAMRLHAMEAWISLAGVQAATHSLSDDIMERREYGWLRLIGRLAPGRSLDDAQREASRLAERLGATYPENEGRGIRVFPGSGMNDDERIDATRIPRLLLIAVGLLLVIACANVASLTLVRASAKRRELATRLALGASRATLVRQLFIEGTIIAFGAAVVGVGVAQLLIRSASVVQTVVTLRGLPIEADWRVLVAALAIGSMTAILVTAIPGMQVSRTQLATLIKDGSGGAVGTRANAQRFLVATQVGVSLVLLVAAATIYGEFQRILKVDPGFDARQLSFALLDTHTDSVGDVRMRRFYGALLATAPSTADIGEIALTTTVPPRLWGSRVSVFHPGDEPPLSVLAGHELSLGVRPYFDIISPNLFEVMHIPLESGRAFTIHDDAQSPPVVIVNRRLANEMWPKQNPVGELLSWPSLTGPRRAPLRVVGVVGNTRHASLAADPPPVMYVPFAQSLDAPNLFAIIRAPTSVASSMDALRHVTASLDSHVSVRDGSNVAQHLEDEVAPQKIATMWIGVFGAIALFLASIGLYGVVSQGVLRRTRELAVRAALGATPNGLRSMILGQGMRLAALGGGVGMLGSVVAMQAVRRVFPSTGILDLKTVVIAVVVLAIAMFSASYLPARRAARLNPLDALRAD